MHPVTLTSLTTQELLALAGYEAAEADLAP